MELLVAIAIGTLTSSGVYLMLRQRSFPVILGLSLLSYAVNLFIFAAGRLAPDLPPIISKTALGYTDPVCAPPRALPRPALAASSRTTPTQD